MKKKLNLLLALLLTAICGTASAEEETKEKIEGGVFHQSNFGASVALTTDYVFRGISQTDEDPAIQGSLDYAHPSGFYLGVWASNVDEAISRGNIEIDYYAGYTAEFSKGFSYDVSLIYYSYPSGGNDPEPDYIEGHLGLAYAFSDIPLEPSLGVGYNYSPDFYGEDGDAHYINGTLDVTLPAGFGLGFELGYQDVEGDKTTGNNMGEDGADGFDYWHWRIGLSKELKGFELDLSYYDTNEEDFLGKIGESRFVFTISRTF